MVNEEERLPKRVRHPRCKRARDQQPDRDVPVDRRPVHHEVMADRDPAFTRAHALQERAFGDRHVHARVPFHHAEQPSLGLRARRLDHPRPKEHTEQDGEDHDHDHAADELGERELPSDENDEKDAELDHEVRRREFERHRRGEVGAFAEQRACERYRGVRARRRCCAQRRGDGETTRRVVREKPAHLGFRHDGLNDGRQGES